MNCIAIVGRPNVGKSALFNRLLRKRVAIVDKMSGVTRDRIYGHLEWRGSLFTVIDTGGVELGSADTVRQQVLEQVNLSVEEARLVLLVVDVKDGLVPLDEEISKILRRSGKPVIVVVNKVDNRKLAEGVNRFHKLGWEETIGISALHGLAIDDLLNKFGCFVSGPVTAVVPAVEQPAIRVAVIGRPNVGKSTFINALVGKPRMIVDEKPGTTRDAVDIMVSRGDKSWQFIDTGGMRRKKRLESAVEFYSITRAYQSVERADVIVLMVDGWEGIRVQEAKLLDHISERGKGCVIAINKWDLVTEVATTAYRRRVYERLPQHGYVPVVFISALKGQNIDEMLQGIEYVFSQLRQEIATGILNRVIREAVAVNRPPLVKGKPLRIYYSTQVGVAPPQIALFVNDPARMRKNYLGFLSNQLRQAFGFEGVPLKWRLRQRKRKK